VATVTCKYCNEDGLMWMEVSGRWTLMKEGRDSGLVRREKHVCSGPMPDVTASASCKFCGAQDLVWTEEKTKDGKPKAVLTESYGLPHACDQRIEFMAKQRQERKLKYEAAKTRILGAHPGPCGACKGNGFWDGKICAACCGEGTFNDRSRRRMLSYERSQIWPQQFYKNDYAGRR
jgi:hypothetical protein